MLRGAKKGGERGGEIGGRGLSVRNDSKGYEDHTYVRLASGEPDVGYVAQG